MLGLSRGQLIKGLAVSICMVGVSWLVLEYLVPAPPTEITIATGSPSQTYEAIGKKYREILGRSNVNVVVRNTPGAIDNLKLLNDPNSGVQVAIVQGGVGDRDKYPNLISLGRVTYQFFWIFYRGAETLSDLRQLKGKRVALGLVGSGGRVLAEDILKLGGVDSNTTTLLGRTVSEATNDLNAGRIDAMFLTIAADSPLLRTLLTTPDVKLMSLSRAEALPRIYPYVVRIVVPQGLFDWNNNIPSTDVSIVATTLNVMVRKDFHPAVIGLLAQAMVETHSRAGIFQQAGEFPTQIDPEYPVSEIARDFYRDGPSFLNRYLPFWMTSYAKRTIAVLVAIFAIVLPLFNYVPKLYRWHFRERILKLYRRLRAIDRKLHSELTESQLTDLQRNLESIERAAGTLGVPNRFSDLFFSFKIHIDLTRTRLAARLVEVRSQIAKAA
jgi:TRAP transporter TAXI family solute receptor